MCSTLRVSRFCQLYEGSEGLRHFCRSVFLCRPCIKVWEQDLDCLPPLPEDTGLWEGKEMGKKIIKQGQMSIGKRNKK